MSDALAVGVIGVGAIGQSHIQAIEDSKNVRLVAVMDIDAGRAKRAGEGHGARAYTSVDALLEDRAVQAVHVCSPHNQHADQVTAAAQSGKHVLVEKPMALTLPDCDRMIAACRRAGTVLMVGQVLRHFPVNRKIRELITDGAIGNVGHLMRRRHCYFDTTSPQSSYGSWYLDLDVGGICVLYCFGPHEYDILHWYMSSPVARVYAQGTESTELYRGQKDSYTSMMTHANGAVSVLSQSVVCRVGGYDQTIVGSHGSIATTNEKLILNEEEILVEGTGNAMRNQIEEFAVCCMEGREPDASGRSVRHTMAVIEASKQSAERNEPVEVSEFE